MWHPQHHGFPAPAAARCPDRRFVGICVGMYVGMYVGIVGLIQNSVSHPLNPALENGYWTEALHRSDFYHCKVFMAIWDVFSRGNNNTAGLAFRGVVP